MTRPALTAFLDAPSRLDEAERPTETIEAAELQLQRVLGLVVGRIGHEEAVVAAGIDSEQAAGLLAVANGDRSDPVANLSLADAAAILAADMAFSQVEVRGRIRDHLLVAMSRGPTDVNALSEAYGFADPATLRAKIDSVETLTLREYARLRIAVGTAERNHNA